MVFTTNSQKIRPGWPCHPSLLFFWVHYFLGYSGYSCVLMHWPSFLVSSLGMCFISHCTMRNIELSHPYTDPIKDYGNTMRCTTTSILKLKLLAYLRFYGIGFLVPCLQKMKKFHKYGVTIVLNLDVHPSLKVRCMSLRNILMKKLIPKASTRNRMIFGQRFDFTLLFISLFTMSIVRYI